MVELNYYERSIKELRKRIKEDYKLTQEEWDTYAKNHALYSSITLCAHKEAENWEQLKLEMDEPEKRIYTQIRQMRKKLYKKIDQYGLQAEETKQVNNMLQNLINDYYIVVHERYKQNPKLYPTENKLYAWSQESYQMLKNMTKQQGGFPTVKEWNQFAQTQNYISSQGLEYILGCDWNKIRVRILREIE